VASNVIFGDVDARRLFYLRCFAFESLRHDGRRAEARQLISRSLTTAADIGYEQTS